MSHKQQTKIRTIFISIDESNIIMKGRILCNIVEVEYFKVNFMTFIVKALNNSFDMQVNSMLFKVIEIHVFFLQSELKSELRT